MKKADPDSTFIIGFFTGIVACIAANIYSLWANYGGCLDCYGEFGVPFKLGDAAVFKHLSFYWFGLIGDVLFAIAFSYALGLAFRFVYSKLISGPVR